MSKRKKPRRRTSKKVPAKGRLREFADTLWSRAVELDWAGKCAVCGASRSQAKCEAHHLIPRAHQLTRYELENGVWLCATHHQFDNDLSPHLNAAGWIVWLRDNLPGRYAWYMDQTESGDYARFNGQLNAWHYIEVIQELIPHLPDEDVAALAKERGYVLFLDWLDTQET